MNIFKIDKVLDEICLPKNLKYTSESELYNLTVDTKAIGIITERNTCNFFFLGWSYELDKGNKKQALKGQNKLQGWVTSKRPIQTKKKPK